MTRWPINHLTADDLDAFHTASLTVQAREHLEECEECRRMALLDHAVTERFMKAEHRAMLLCEDTPSAVLGAVESYEPPVVDKWLDRTAQT